MTDKFDVMEVHFSLVGMENEFVYFVLPSQLEDVNEWLMVPSDAPKTYICFDDLFKGCGVILDVLAISAVNIKKVPFILNKPTAPEDSYLNIYTMGKSKPMRVDKVILSVDEDGIDSITSMFEDFDDDDGESTDTDFFRIPTKDGETYVSMRGAVAIEVFHQ